MGSIQFEAAFNITHCCSSHLEGCEAGVINPGAWPRVADGRGVSPSTCTNYCWEAKLRQEDDSGEGEEGSGGKRSNVPETDGEGRMENSPPVIRTMMHENPAVHDSKLTAGSHQEAAGCQQTPTNEWKA